MITLDGLREQLRGARVVRLDGDDDAGGPRLTAIVFDEGTILRFRWTTGIGAEVGLRVGRAVPTPGGRGRRAGA